MDVWLLRHGNTFGPRDRVVWLGAADDPPLVEGGVAQIHRVAEAFGRARIHPAFAFSAPCLRARQCIQILERSSSRPLPAWEDWRLAELDYGGWNGLTNAEIASRFGEDVLHAWLHYGVFPTRLGWRPSAEQLKGEAAAVLEDLVAGSREAGVPALIVSTNSRLCSLLHAVDGAAEVLARRGELSCNGPRSFP